MHAYRIKQHSAMALFVVYFHMGGGNGTFRWIPPLLILTSIHAFIGLCIVRPPRVRMHNLQVYDFVLMWVEE